MSAQPAESEAEVFEEEEYEEYDEFDDEEDSEKGLSGLVVLLMGVVMLGAFASVVWIAYQQGIKTANNGGDNAPYVAADPEPLKIENQTAAIAGGNDREVYDRLEGEAGEPVETLAAGPEEPIARDSIDPIGDIASSTDDTITDDAVADRIASLAAADEELSQQEIEPAPVAPQAPAATAPTATPPPAAAPEVSDGDALSGTHLVQVGAFGSVNEADGQWLRLRTRLGDYLGGKSQDVERADLGEKGVFYRLRIGPFASGDDAKTFCEGLKTRGQDCLVKPK